MDRHELLSCCRYLFFFAHPDDDVYCCVLMRMILDAGKEVEVVYATSGDAGGSRRRREREARRAMKAIGVRPRLVHFIRTPERKLVEQIALTVRSTTKTFAKRRPDCIVGHDYEGGHEGHDLASFCASEVGRLARVEKQFVFPVYHGPPEKRIGARFKPGREAHLVLPFGRSGRGLKERVLACYGSQSEHFRGLGLASGDFYDLLLSREVYFQISEPIDYSRKPAEDVGYEFHRNRFTFEDFTRALIAYEEQVN